MPFDYNLRTFPYANFSIPSESPFFPVVFNTVGNVKKVRFNQGYVFDYQSYNSSGINKISVAMEDEYPAQGDYYVKITTGPKTAKITTAELVQGNQDAADSFHYSAENLDPSLAVYTNGEGNFQIPACSFESNGAIKNVYLRENIHWQKINFANLPKNTGKNPPANSFGVLYNWGDSTQFKDNPTVKFARLEQKNSSGEYPNGKEKVIKLEPSVTEAGNIVITTQFPEILDDETSLLVRKKENEWQWMNPVKGYTQLFLYNVSGDASGDAMEFFDVGENTMIYFKDRQPKTLPFPDSGSATPEDPYHLIYDGNLPSWLKDGGVGGSYHPWKVTAQNSGELASWDVAGGTVYTQGNQFPVADDNFVGEYGHIVLKIDRNLNDREITSASLSFEPTIPTSSYDSQYRLIATVNSSADRKITQYQFEEMRIYEELIVENGEFKLQGYEVSHQNNYEPPV